LWSQVDGGYEVLYGTGNSYSQIADHIEDIYVVHFSKPTITAIIDKLIPNLKE